MTSNGVKIVGYADLPSRAATTASALYGNNMAKFILSVGPTTDKVRMYVCMCVCMYVFECMYVFVCMYVCMHVQFIFTICMYCMYVRMYVCLYSLCMYVYIYVCMYVNKALSVCMYVCAVVREYFCVGESWLLLSGL